MLGRADFWSAMWHTLQFTLYTTPPLVILAFVFAILDEPGAPRPVVLPPRVLPAVHPAVGDDLAHLGVHLHAGLGPLGLVADRRRHHAGRRRAGQPDTAMIGIAIATVWWTLGFNFVLYLAGLQEIPRELYEAAAVDGATTWEQIRYITLPLLSRTTTLVILLQIIASLKIFDQVYLMTSGGPGISTQVALTLITGTGFTDNRIGAASAAVGAPLHRHHRDRRRPAGHRPRRPGKAA